MPDDTTQTFLTWKSLGSYGGASLAVAIVSNTIRTLAKWDSPWPAFLASIGISLGGAHVLGALHSGSDIGLAVLNACLLFCGALGMNTTALGVHASAKAPPAQFEQHGRTRPAWLSPWFRRAPPNPPTSSAGKSA